MKTEQINKVLSLSKRKKEINETLKIINNSENCELAFILTGRNTTEVTEIGHTRHSVKGVEQNIEQNVKKIIKC